jgi:pyridoxal/pyridoxine/pyridoxamine kinase
VYHQVQSLEDAAAACLLLHRQGPPVVIVTSLELPKTQLGLNEGASSSAAVELGGEGNLVMIGSCATKRWAAHQANDVTAPPANRNESSGDEEEDVRMWALTIPKLEGAYTGTGDLTSALFLAFLTPPEDAGNGQSSSAAGSGNVGAAVAEAAVAAVPTALRNVAGGVAAVLARTLSESGQGAELRLVQSKRDLESPNPEAFGIGQPVQLPSDLVARARHRVQQEHGK